MSTLDFRMQIEEDIREYQMRFPYMPNIMKPEWAFNFWVLDKLYSEDEALIEDYIVDYKDDGIDCFVWHEEQLDLFLIQNKYYGDSSRLSSTYIQKDFLTGPITALKSGTYTRSKELQDIYTRFSGEKGFTVNLILYVTNNYCKTPEVMHAIEQFNHNHSNMNALIYGLDEIRDLYYKEPVIARKTMPFTIHTMNKGTQLTVNNNAYKLTQAIDAQYIMVPVYNLYELYKRAEQEAYPIFDSNIREYLGSAGNVNKRIRDTLKDPEDRKNFFFYNNGVTIIVKSVKDLGYKSKWRDYEIQDPQIVNGCQTVSTISEVFTGWPKETIEEDFKNTFVMLKILVIPDDRTEMEELRRNIVTYNNSQNSIDQKAFGASAVEFSRVQSEFKRKGLLVCIKQSDKYKFTKKEYRKPSDLIKTNAELFERFGLPNFKNTLDYIVELEKLLQVVLAFLTTAQKATRDKSKLLKAGSEENKMVIDFIKNRVTINDLISLWMLYLKADYEKSQGDDGKFPIPLYVIHCFSRYECNGNPDKIKDYLSDEKKIAYSIRMYKVTFTGYFKKWGMKNPTLGYNDMIKNPIDYNEMDQSREMAIAALSIL